MSSRPALAAWSVPRQTGIYIIRALLKKNPERKGKENKSTVDMGI